ncbi:hypothetical protein EI94DRAFT_1785746 [Lactarius quietus]|nr:hypothetical protein EI94DRAFT_1785746 [Lactarius quietus]
MRVERALPLKQSLKRRICLKKRTLKRAEHAEARRVKAEEHKEAGNACFLKGKYREAIAEYEVAIKIRAWLKLEEYDAAEKCASRALALDPKFHRARFCRGQACRGNLQLALAFVDFATVLGEQPSWTETKKELGEIIVLLKDRKEEDEHVEPKDCIPFLRDPKVELESVSDSSDWNHEGNSFPCSYYNHDGCTQGVKCEFSHGPDHRSVRDRLGRNVCVNFLVGTCLGGCVYSHDKTFLPSGRWWEKEDKRAYVRDMLTWDALRLKPDSLPQLLAIMDSRIAWTPKHTAKVEEAHVWKNHIMMLEGFGEDLEDLEYATWVSKGKHGPRPICRLRCGQCG